MRNIGFRTGMREYPGFRISHCSSHGVQLEEKKQEVKMNTWNWPQWVMATLCLISVLANLINAVNEPGLRGMCTVLATAIMTSLFVWILHCGGFW